MTCMIYVFPPNTGADEIDKYIKHFKPTYNGTLGKIAGRMVNTNKEFCVIYHATTDSWFIRQECLPVSRDYVFRYRKGFFDDTIIGEIK